jgi:PAS domain S-box-containing protein
VLVVPIVALIAALVAIYSVEGEVRRADQTVQGFYALRAQLVELRSQLDDADASLGGFRTTGQGRFLELYNTARSQIGHSLDVLQPMVSGDDAARADFAGIARLAAEDLSLLEQLRKADTRSDAALAERERIAMKDLGARITLLNDREERLFADARYQREVASRRLFLTVLICGVLGPLGAMLIHVVLAGGIVRRIRAVEENARRLADGLPLEPSPAGTDEIATLSSQIEDAAFLLRGQERELRESERRYRDLFDHAPVPFEEIDRNGVIRRFNYAVCLLLKCESSQMAGRRAWDFVSPERQEEFRSAMMRRMAEGSEIGPIECDYALADGTQLNLEIRENLIRNDQGEVTGMVRSLLDVTTRKLAAVAARKAAEYAMEVRNKNDQLARALETARSAAVAKSRFLASVSHELRTPLNGIIGFSELLYDGKLGNIGEEHREVLGDILASSRLLLKIIDDLLDLSKVEAGRMEFRPARHVLETLVLEVRDTLRPAADRKVIGLSVDVPPGLVANLDGTRFKQVVFNYLSNAIKFTPAQGSISIRVSTQGNGVFRLEVEDNGVGVPDDEIPLLFQEFARLPHSRKAGQGTGLGLALTRRIVEAQGGSVAVRSIQGQGSIFSAVLPLESIVRSSVS